MTLIITKYSCLNPFPSFTGSNRGSLWKARQLPYQVHRCTTTKVLLARPLTWFWVMAPPMTLCTPPQASTHVVPITHRHPTPAPWTQGFAQTLWMKKWRTANIHHPARNHGDAVTTGFSQRRLYPDPTLNQRTCLVCLRKQQHKYKAASNVSHYKRT